MVWNWLQMMTRGVGLLSNNVLSLLSALLARLSRCAAVFCSGFSVLYYAGSCLQAKYAG